MSRCRHLALVDGVTFPPNGSNTICFIILGAKSSCLEFSPQISMIRATEWNPVRNICYCFILHLFIHEITKINLFNVPAVSELWLCPF